MQNTSDAALAVLKESGPQLHALLQRLTLRAEVAEDLLQELFLKLSRSAAFGGAKNRAAYAYRAAVHLAFDWRRAQRPERATLDASDPEERNATPPLQRLVADEQMEKVLEAVGTLRGLQRHVLVMHYIQQESFQSIAKQFDKTPHQVRALCHKAVRHLRQKLAGDQPAGNPQEHPRGQT